ncbi:PaaI family thioesterase [Bradyrhizobium sediminis]|uniref:PaaI family thioesterase n=1 Tax=Bradyrhizobium sediminis TaxID=2840469 RepID=A0A975RYG1_9BRAD|nr:PaaI family thioesterase [Bradyrhizobium sediminis]
MKRGEPTLIQHQQHPRKFDIEEARRVLGDVFAPWVQDLNLSIEGIDYEPPQTAAAGWQPGAVLRMPFSERLCRNGGIVCGQALMAFADTAMVIANLAANRGYRPMTTVDQTTHFMRAATASDVLADARVVRMGRTMSFGHVTLSSAHDNKPVAMVSSAFAMLT